MNIDGTVTRREFLSTGGLTAAGLMMGCTSPKSERIGIIDTHTHFYDPTRPEGVSWPPKDDRILYRPILPEEFKRLSEPLGVTGTVVVEASPRIEDNQWILNLAAEEKVLLGFVGHLKPGRAGFAGDLNRFAANPRFRGIRTGGWEVKLAPDNPDYLRDLSLLADRDLSLDVLVGPNELSAVATLASKLTSLRIIINHCANVRVDGKVPPAAWVDGIHACARSPRVCMKVSGLVEGTGHTDGNAPRDVQFYQPTLDVIWESFGEDRVIFGSNWPVCTRFASYAIVLGIVKDYFDAKGHSAAQKYLERNAQSFYRWPRT